LAHAIAALPAHVQKLWQEPNLPVKTNVYKCVARSDLWTAKKNGQEVRKIPIFKIKNYLIVMIVFSIIGAVIIVAQVG